MKLKTTRTWTTRSGKRRVVRLYASWKNMLQRTRGTGRAGNGANYWVGKPVEWATYEEFHIWATISGYCKEKCSLDRWDAEDGYTRDNCQWMTVADNTRRENAARWAPGSSSPYTAGTARESLAAA